MPLVTCPCCGRKIDLPFNELSLTIECAKCEIRFQPLGERAAAWACFPLKRAQ
jgi:hypothetical protein